MLRERTYLSIFLSIASAMLLPAIAPARQSSVPHDPSGAAGLEGMIPTASLDVYLQESNGAPVESLAVVTLTTLAGRTYRQGTTKSGYVRFNDLAATEYKIQVVAPAYERAVSQAEAIGFTTKRVTIMLRPAGEAEDVATPLSLAALKPKAQKEVIKAMEALRAQKPEAARGHLEAVDRLAPHQPEVAYLFGVYSSQVNAWDNAKLYWVQTLALNPKHLRALLSLGEISFREKKITEAMDYAKRAVEADSAAWRAHALLAEAALLQGLKDESVKEAERALELAHGQASMLEPLLARALAERGDKERASVLLEAYVHGHPADTAAKKQLESLHAASVSVESIAAPTAEDSNAAALSEIVLATMGRSTWMPPDIDESVPPVEPGATCALDEIVRNAGARMQELIHNVDRFTATETVTHESINKRGLPSAAETAKFDYMVSIEALGGGFLNVEEYRQIKNSSPGFPDSVRTNGLPAMVLVFHPRFTKNYEMSCEGLARANGQLAWQVHFRQGKDRPNELRRYRLGGYGPAYPVAVKGRAWIAAETYQIVRMETDLVAPLPEIRLAVDHIAVEYGPVHFQRDALDMWLPQNADVFYEWRGQRVHRRHTFSHYLLFAVDDKQRISTPKVEDRSSSENEKPN
jgi:tetratricopeptide (TPR) repeat protein